VRIEDLVIKLQCGLAKKALSGFPMSSSNQSRGTLVSVEKHS